MDQKPLVTGQIAAAAAFLGELDAFLPIKAAFWAKASDEERWYLYVASDKLDQFDIGLAYGEVVRLVSRMRDPNLDPFHVKLIKATDPMVRDVLTFQARYPGKMPTHFHGSQLGDVSIDGAYIYASPISAVT